MPSNYRITTGGTMRTYSTNLTKNRKTLNEAMERVQTQRAFASYAEDPAAAAKAWSLRRSLDRTNDQYENTGTLFGKFSVAFTAIDSITDKGGSSGIAVDALTKTLEALNSTTGSGRCADGQAIVNYAESIITTLNSAKYGEDFIFAGADAQNCPFSWEVDADGNRTGALLYRGLDVSNPQVISDSNGNVRLAEEKTESDFTDENGELDTAAYEAYQAQRADAEKLISYSKEKTYVDVGMGLQETESGEFVTSSGYNSSVNGLQILGFGVDEDGNAVNLAVITRQVGELFAASDPDTGGMAEEDMEAAEALYGRLGDAINHTITQHVELASQCEYLEDNQTRLKEQFDTLNTELEEVERVDEVDAIIEFSYANYCYNACLQIGNSVLSQSLLDYMS